jgi:hypothetical protein
VRKTAQAVALFFVLGMLPATAGSWSQNAAPTCPTPEEITDPKFVPGQVWKYKNREHEDASTVTILRVEQVKSIATTETVIHIRIDRVRLRGCNNAQEPNSFDHMPISRAALERSVTTEVKPKKEGKAPKIPDFHEAYAEWRKQCGDLYKITVAEAVQAAEDDFRKSLGCK